MINIKQLSYCYPGNTRDTLNAVDLDVAKGEVFGLLGPSGAGKSTLQKVLIGLLPGFRGEATLLGKSLNEWGNTLYEKIGVSFELPNHFLKLTARENLDFFLRFYHQPKYNVDEVLSMVGLSDSVDQRVGSFSKGMKNRLSFARALIHQPQLYFLDEPTTGQDPNNIQQFKNIIGMLKQSGKTVLINTHNMTIAEQVCDRVAFIIDGEIKQVGKPFELKIQHGNPSVCVEYIDQGDLRQQIFELETLGDDLDFAALIKAHEIRTIHSREADLEEVFIKLTGRQLTSDES